MAQSGNIHDSSVINRKGGSLMENQTLAERIQLLEDVEEIRRLQATYMISQCIVAELKNCSQKMPHGNVSF
jgi:hypothetical protein